MKNKELDFLNSSFKLSVSVIRQCGEHLTDMLLARKNEVAKKQSLKE